jgi:hypothetical protein
MQQLNQNEKYCLVLHEKNVKLKDEVRTFEGKKEPRPSQRNLSPQIEKELREVAQIQKQNGILQK